MSIADVNSPKSLYIKLGPGGQWEAECTREGTLRLGYAEFPHDICSDARWSEAQEHAQKIFTDRGASTNHVRQVRTFYEEPESTLWITFFSDRMWWCHARPGVELLEDKTKLRRTVDGWHDKDIHGNLLLRSTLSGKLLATGSFRGTICSVTEHSYLQNKINGDVEPHVVAAQNALKELIDSLVPIIQKLHPTDLEVLTDLLFRQAGWNRMGVVGGTEKDIDLDLLSPITGERIAVQVKSKASKQLYSDYRAKFGDTRGYARFYFVTHSPDEQLMQVAKQDDDNFEFWGPKQLAEHAARNGLVGWLVDKAS